MNEVNPKVNKVVSELGQNDADNRAVLGSGSSDCSVVFTKDEILEKVKQWVESHNPEFDWDWTNLQNIHREMVQCVRLSGTCEIQNLMDSFDRST